MSHSSLNHLLQRVQQDDPSVPADIPALLKDISALFDGPLADGDLNAFKVAGAWPSKPLPANTPSNPYCVDLSPILQTGASATTPHPGFRIDVTNLTPAQLAGVIKHVTPTSDGRGNTLLTIPALLR